MLHSWDVSFKEAKAIQEGLRSQIRLTPLKKRVCTIAGVDISHNRFSKVLFAGIVVLSYPELVTLEEVTVRFVTTFPYVPGYLSFREIPALIEAFKKLRTKPDILVVDGHGVAHPRRLGIATHLSLVTGVPSIGCAKNRLYGIGKEPRKSVGSTSELIDPKTDEVIGMYLRTRSRAKPIIVSPGDRVTIDHSLVLIRTCLRGYRLPEPTRRAHLLVNLARRAELK